MLKNSGLPQGIASPTPAFPSQTIIVNNVGQTGLNQAGTIFTGVTAGDETGWSLAMVGDVSRSTTNANQSDLVIGAPQNGFFTGVGARTAWPTSSTPTPRRRSSICPRRLAASPALTFRRSPP